MTIKNLQTLINEKWEKAEQCVQIGDACKAEACARDLARDNDAWATKSNEAQEMYELGLTYANQATELEKELEAI
jgi:hypothetical protein|tara:strand:- start:3 stop:227 length:225 start_codon:yes stop_codon:yes gene_type:complete